MRRIAAFGNPAGRRGKHYHPISIYEIVAVHKQTYLFMGAEDRPNSVAKTGACIFGSTCPEGFGDGNGLNGRGNLSMARPSRESYIRDWLPVRR